MSRTKFHRHLDVKGYPLYWILIVYMIVGYFYPVIGFIAFICMIAPVLVSLRKGRRWCGNACPRGNLFDRLLSRYSPHRPIPRLLRSFAFRLLMVCFIFTVFGVQMAQAWGDWSSMGKVFWNIILATTVVSVVLAFLYAPRAWCAFCPMGTLSSWVAPKKTPLPRGYRSVHVSEKCQMKCKSCARVCPMQLAPYDSRGDENGYLHPDCIKCGKCVIACPVKIMELKE